MNFFSVLCFVGCVFSGVTLFNSEKSLSCWNYLCDPMLQLLGSVLCIVDSQVNTVTIGYE